MSHSQDEYRNYAGFTDKDYLELALNWAEPIKKRAAELMNLKNGSRVLDIGCGSGVDLVRYAKQVGDDGLVAGIDLDKGLLDEAENRFGQDGINCKLDLRQGNALNLPFEDNHFDAVHTERVLMHIEDAQTAISEFVRVTKPGGRIVLVETDLGTWSTYTPHSDIWNRYSTYLVENVLANGYAGRRLAHQLSTAGTKQVHREAHSWVFEDYILFRRMADSNNQTKELVINAGVITKEELSLLEQSFEQAQRANAFHSTNTFIIARGIKAEI